MKKIRLSQHVRAIKFLWLKIVYVGLKLVMGCYLLRSNENIAAVLVDVSNRSLISWFCSSAKICSFYRLI